LLDGGVELAGLRYRKKFSGVDSQLTKKTFLRKPILRRFECGRRGINGNALREKFRGFDGNIFKFVGNQLQSIGKFLECGMIGVVGRDTLGNAANRGFWRRIEKPEVQAEGIAR